MPGCETAGAATAPSSLEETKQVRETERLQGKARGQCCAFRVQGAELRCQMGSWSQTSLRGHAEPFGFRSNGRFNRVGKICTKIK